jgi:hypothetical protein
MTAESRAAFVLFFFAVWCFVGLVPWAIAAVVARGRGALAALPVALAAACAAGVAIPLIGLDDFRGFLLGLVVAFTAAAVGSVAGIRIAQRLWPMRAANELRRRGRARAADSGTTHLTRGPDT